MSIAEKATLPSTDGRVLLLPCEPGNEIDEILDAGFCLEDIDAFEKDKKLASVLRDHYGGDLMVHDTDVFKHLDQSELGPWSYVHIDLCGYMRFEHLDTLQRIIPNLADNCRVRITQYPSYRSKKIPWKTLAKNRNYKTWGNWYDILLAANMVEPKERGYNFLLDHDAKLVLLSYMLLAFGFGSSYADYSADFDANNKYIPAVISPFSIEDVKHLRYREEKKQTDMISVWFDLRRTNEPYKRAEVLKVMQEIIGSASYTRSIASTTDQLTHILQ